MICHSSHFLPCDTRVDKVVLQNRKKEFPLTRQYHWAQFLYQVNFSLSLFAFSKCLGRFACWPALFLWVVGFALRVLEIDPTFSCQQIITSLLSTWYPHSLFCLFVYIYSSFHGKKLEKLTSVINHLLLKNSYVSIYLLLHLLKNST